MNSTEPKPQERRRLKRRYLAFFTRVYDRNSGQMLGHLDNVSTEGAMIIGQFPIQSGQTFRLRMDLSEYIFGKAHLDFDAISAWCQPDLDPTFYNTGLKFIDIAPDDMEIIEKIMTEYVIHE